MKKCQACGTELPLEAKFCYHCGSPQADPIWHEQVSFAPGEDLTQKIINQFFPALQERIVSEMNTNDYARYAERIYESGFRDLLHRRAAVMAEKIEQSHTEGLTDQQAIGYWMQKFNSELLDYFLIRHCQDLNPLPLPEAILRYQGASWPSLNLFQMVLDYLDFAREDEAVYTDFLIMPIEKLKNASKSFLFPGKKEKILLVCDQSLFGSCKEGFALTENALYWKAHLEKAQQVAFSDLREVKRHKEWITINGFFFNVNPTLNFKMLMLMKKIKQMKESF
ncbi:MAG: zinc ribbon domain-containing protein [Saprospiraceae bacterium]